MSALAAYLRQQTAAEVGRMDPDERIRLALSLGDEDVQLYRAATGVSDEEARRRLTVTRQIGRRASVAATAGQ